MDCSQSGRCWILLNLCCVIFKAKDSVELYSGREMIGFIEGKSFPYIRSRICGILLIQSLCVTGHPRP